MSGNQLPEALVTGAGLVLGAIATFVSLLHEEKPSPARRALFVVALFVLVAGLYTTKMQYQDANDAANAASAAECARKSAAKQLTDLQQRAGDLAHVDAQIQSRTNDLTMLNELGSGSENQRYYVVIDTFKRNSPRNQSDFESIWCKLSTLYPTAQSSGLLWAAPNPGNKSFYELRFGRNLTPSSAALFLDLASHGLSNGNGWIRRESGPVAAQPLSAITGFTPAPCGGHAVKLGAAPIQPQAHAISSAENTLPSHPH